MYSEQKKQLGIETFGCCELTLTELGRSYWANPRPNWFTPHPA